MQTGVDDRCTSDDDTGAPVPDRRGRLAAVGLVSARRDRARARHAGDDAGGDQARSSATRRCSKGKVKLDLPPLVENGNTVPLTVTVESPMTAADHVKAIHVFTEKNPQPNVVERPARPARRHAPASRPASGSPTRRP